MKIGKACAIFMQIDSDEYTVEEKGTAIYEVLKMPTHNGINKDKMLSVIWYLLNLTFDIPEKETKVCAGGRLKNFAVPALNCAKCSFSKRREVTEDEGI